MRQAIVALIAVLTALSLTGAAEATGTIVFTEEGTFLVSKAAAAGAEAPPITEAVYRLVLHQATTITFTLDVQPLVADDRAGFTDNVMSLTVDGKARVSGRPIIEPLRLTQTLAAGSHTLLVSYDEGVSGVHWTLTGVS